MSSRTSGHNVLILSLFLGSAFPTSHSRYAIVYRVLCVQFDPERIVCMRLSSFLLLVKSPQTKHARRCAYLGFGNPVWPMFENFVSSRCPCCLTAATDKISRPLKDCQRGI